MRFSVIIPVYNVAPYLRDCLDSVLTASRGYEVEVLAIDDGSTDGSSEILDSYKPRVIVEHRSNGGVSAARNRALELATGDWIVFVDADDFVRETIFEDLSQTIAAHPGCDLVAYGLNGLWDRLDWGSSDLTPTEVEISSAIPSALALRSFGQHAYRRDVLGGIRFPAIHGGEDIVFACRYFARATRCVSFERVEYIYRYREGSATHVELTPAKMRDAIEFHVLMFRALADSGKRIGFAFSRIRANQLIEFHPKKILPRLKEPAWREVWERWLDALGEIADLPFFSRWQRFVMHKVSASRSPWLVRLLCLLPARLAAKGLLRRRTLNDVRDPRCRDL